LNKQHCKLKDDHTTMIHENYGLMKKLNHLTIDRTNNKSDKSKVTKQTNNHDNNCTVKNTSINNTNDNIVGK